MAKNDDVLTFILELNEEVANKEDAGEQVAGPGLPAFVNDKAQFVSGDCLRL